ncbi:unnamed protein product [Rangifer tarandus platyrhynchus]|uniref:Uncharacterized protein n=1 Tax=Rangifer tarandus platyrhynchus TaxID=3082113 RepID=A0AC60A6P5_RANTA
MKSPAPRANHPWKEGSCAERLRQGSPRLRGAAEKMRRIYKMFCSSAQLLKLKYLFSIRKWLRALAQSHEVRGLGTSQAPQRDSGCLSHASSRHLSTTTAPESELKPFLGLARASSSLPSPPESRAVQRPLLVTYLASLLMDLGTGLPFPALKIGECHSAAGRDVSAAFAWEERVPSGWRRRSGRHAAGWPEKRRILYHCATWEALCQDCSHSHHVESK